MNRLPEFSSLCSAIGGGLSVFSAVSPSLREGGRVKDDEFCNRSARVLGHLLAISRQVRREDEGGLGSSWEAPHQDSAPRLTVDAATNSVLILKQQVSQLEDQANAEDSTSHSSPDQRRHRHESLKTLSELLSSITETLKEEQVKELERQVEVAGYFAAAAPPKTGKDGNASAAIAIQQARKRNAIQKQFTQTLESHQSTCSVSASEEKVLEQESLQLVASYDSELDAIHQTQLKIHQLSQIMTTFVEKVVEQTEICDQIEQCAVDSTALMGDAGDHLSTAIHRTAKYRLYVLLFFIVGGIIVLMLDFFKSSTWF
eukprot:GHVT01049918.1.p1 GENE.GHVT01049918.1~~GHVT01049918.1.p1  ORF type:complete len:315 (-),score=62.63 GHVT01049918.1:65-1009(-)